VAERCAARGVWVLADEIHGALVLDGARHTPFLEVSDAARSWGVALTSASKAFNLAALKTAFLVTASPASADLVGRLPPLGEHSSLLGNVAAEIAFSRGDAWLDAVLGHLAENRSLLADALADQLPEVRWTPPEGTYLAWLDCRGLGLDADPAQVFLERGRVALGIGPVYGQSGFVRLNFATSPEHLREAVRRMAGAVAAGRL
jgi:cysteine-S-conjugate beta-lyase